MSNSSRTEKTLKFRFVPSSNNDNVHRVILHGHWIHEFQNSHGESVRFIDNSNSLVTKLDHLWIDPEAHMKNFHLHFDCHTQEKNKQRNSPADYQRVTSYIVHRIQTSLSVNEMKAMDSAFKLIQEHDFYVNEHRWSERTDWETTQLGFVHGINPQFYDIDHRHENSSASHP